MLVVISLTLNVVALVLLAVVLVLAVLVPLVMEPRTLGMLILVLLLAHCAFVPLLPLLLLHRHVEVKALWVDWQTGQHIVFTHRLLWLRCLGLCLTEVCLNLPF